MTYTVLTLGCKVNQFETQAMETLLAEHGFTKSEEGGADVIIVNTCAVTAESGRKSRQAIRKLKGENPDAVLAVCGCYSQTAPEDAEELGADIVYGSGDRRKMVEDVIACANERAKYRLIDDPFKRTVFESLPAGAMDGRTRAYMKIQDGCDNFCSYCIIPYARGRVRSMPIAEAAEQAQALNAEGYKEIIVTGIEISSYGKDLRDGSSLADIICAVAQAAPDARIRLGSIEPTVITNEFASRLAECGNICPHFHLSLQSGCDKTLKNMRRKYDTARFYESASILREHFPECAITADLITGFPGETDEDHKATLAFIEKCAFSQMHVFPYSIRPGTKAAEMPDQLQRSVKEARAREASRLASRMQEVYLDSMVGKNLPVLYETEHDGLWQGHSGNYCEVVAEGENLHGKAFMTKILERKGKKLYGKVIDFADLIQ